MRNSKFGLLGGGLLLGALALLVALALHPGYPARAQTMSVANGVNWRAADGGEAPVALSSLSDDSDTPPAPALAGPEMFAPLPSGPIRVECAYPAVEGWAVVQTYLVSSWCGTDWTCWSSWISYDPSNALLESITENPRFFLDHGIATPAGFPPHGTIYDPRLKCEDGAWAKGWWYHNAYARAGWRYIVLPGDPPFLQCYWMVDPPYKHISNFAEGDTCPPSCDIDPGTTPPATVCKDPPPVVNPTNPPLTPVPEVLTPPEIRPYAWVRASRIGNGARYRTPTDRAFYWPWQMYLNASFSAEIEEPTYGCAASTVVTRYKFLGLGGDRDLCNIDDDAMGSVDGMVCLAPNGKCCLWHTPEQEVHLLFSDNPARQPVSQENSIFISVQKPGPVSLHVVVEVVTTYTCSGDPPGATRQIPHYAYGNLTVILTKTAPQPVQP